MDEEKALSLAKNVLSVLWKPAKACARKVRVWWFRWRTRKPPLSDANSKKIAYSVLAGDVLSAISFRNIDCPHLLIACLRKSSESDYDPRACVLEQFGDAFKPTWKSEPLFSTSPQTFEVRDIDGDGNREVIFESASYGTGGGSRSLMVYAVQKARLFSVTESLNWQNRAGPISPEIEINTADTPDILPALEGVAKKHGFLQSSKPVDFDSPEFSVERWHKENGERTSGTIKIHYYQGSPLLFHQASVVTTLDTSSDTSSIRWISFFKGPLVAYDVLNDRHFVAFSPAWSYNWITCMAWDGKSLWFGTHSSDGLMSFTPSENVLKSYDSFEGTTLPRVESLMFDGILILNGTLRIPLDALATRGFQKQRRVN